MIIRRKALFLGLLLVFTNLNLSFADDPDTYPLLYQTDLVYQGAFRVPSNSLGGSSFAYGGTALTYNGAHNSLFMVGRITDQMSAEISIPTVINSTNRNNLNTSTSLQNFADPTNGTLNAINPGDPNAKLVGGQLVFGSKLYVSAYAYYDGGLTQNKSHWARPLTLSTAGQTQGPYRVGSLYPGFVSGYMTKIPVDWQNLFGGPALTGNCCLAIASGQSNGPAASVFDPGDVGSANPVPATPVVGYPYDHPLGTGGDTKNNLYSFTTRISGMVFPEGSRSVFFIGRHGTGAYCYGTGAACNDPADDSKGSHAYPYVTQIWAYDALDLLKVKNGLKQQYEIQPYAVWSFTLPFGGGTNLLGGAAYDSATQRIFISQMGTDPGDGYFSGPIIHVFKINVPESGVFNNSAEAVVDGVRVHPNPFNPTVIISAGADTYSLLQVMIYTISGRCITDLSSQIRNGQVAWNALPQPTGIYIVKVRVGERVLTKAITLIK